MRMLLRALVWVCEIFRRWSSIPPLHVTFNDVGEDLQEGARWLPWPRWLPCFREISVIISSTADLYDEFFCE